MKSPRNPEIAMTPNPAQDKAFVELVDRYLDRVYRFLRNLTRSEDAAREAAHEAFIRLRGRLETGERPGEAYVFATARNTALSHWRAARNEVRKRETAAGIWCGATSGSVPGGSLEQSELRSGLQAALETLPEDQRSVFLLSSVEGLKYAQIAEIMDIPAGTVGSRKNAAIAALRKELERTGHALP
jgi:RNA polymerase sigma-70 factor (ECF subfamily)